MSSRSHMGRSGIETWYPHTIVSSAIIANLSFTKGLGKPCNKALVQGCTSFPPQPGVSPAMLQEPDPRVTKFSPPASPLCMRFCSNEVICCQPDAGSVVQDTKPLAPDESAEMWATCGWYSYRKVDCGSSPSCLCSACISSRKPHECMNSMRSVVMAADFRISCLSTRSLRNASCDALTCWI